MTPTEVPLRNFAGHCHYTCSVYFLEEMKALHIIQIKDSSPTLMPCTTSPVNSL